MRIFLVIIVKDCPKEVLILSNESGVFEVLITNAVKLPGVQVDRKEFLAISFTKYVSLAQLA